MSCERLGEQKFACCHFEFVQVLACALQWLEIDEREAESILIAVSAAHAGVAVDTKQCVSSNQAA